MKYNIKIPVDVSLILNILKSNGFMAYVVGGCVRDSILNRKPKDWDICTDATPQSIISVFNNYKVIPTGLKHGTITVVINNINYEVTTFRIDGDYSDSRRPDDVLFTNSIIEDLSRRDFTINAMAYNQEEGLIDPFYGLNDIKFKTIKCVGTPCDRFNEDALRMLRAIRFKAQLSFQIDADTQQAIFKKSDKIKSISSERVSDELNKIILSNPTDIYNANYYGLLKYHLPELDICFYTEQENPYHCYNVGTHLINSCVNIDNILYLRLSMLLHDIGKPNCKTIDDFGVAHFYRHSEFSTTMSDIILRRLKYDNDTINKVKTLIEYHDYDIAENKKSIKKVLNKIGIEMLYDLLKVKEADSKAQNQIYFNERNAKIQNIKLLIEGILNEKECFSVKDLAVNGNDLINAGYKQGKEIGDILNRLVEVVIENPELNQKEKLLSLI